MLMTLPEMWDFLSLYLQYSFVQRAMIVTVLVALLIVPALLAWLSYRALRVLATGIVLLILWAIG